MTSSKAAEGNSDQQSCKTLTRKLPAAGEGKDSWLPFKNHRPSISYTHAAQRHYEPAKCIRQFQNNDRSKEFRHQAEPCKQQRDLMKEHSWKALHCVNLKRVASRRPRPSRGATFLRRYEFVKSCNSVRILRISPDWSALQQHQGVSINFTRQKTGDFHLPVDVTH